MTNLGYYLHPLPFLIFLLTLLFCLKRSCLVKKLQHSLPLELELELIQTRMIQKPLLWVEVGKIACVLVGICELRLSPPARYGPQCPSLLDFLSGCLPLALLVFLWRLPTPHRGVLLPAVFDFVMQLACTSSSSILRINLATSWVMSQAGLCYMRGTHLRLYLTSLINRYPR
jgi:hypothetical protein